MEQFLDHMIFVCASAVAVGACICVAAGIFYGINTLTNNKLENFIYNLFAGTED